MWCSLRQSDILDLERSHRLCLKTIQGVSRSTRTCVALSLIGATSLEYEVKRKGILFGQLRRIDTFFAVKRLFLYRLASKLIFHDTKYGFVHDVCQLLSKHEHEHLMVDFMNTGNFPTKQSWKSVLTPRIRHLANRDIISEIGQEGLQLFLTFHPQVKPNMFWNISKKLPRVLNSCKSVMYTEAVCSACGVFTQNYASHCLLSCHANN